jgi:hypothetical protein
MKRLLLVIVAAGAALVPLPPRLVEQLYSSGFYPSWQPFATRVSNLTPVALFDILLVLVAVAWFAAFINDIARRSIVQTLGRALLRTVVWSASFYLLFLGGWGLNYRRVPLIETLQFDADAVKGDNARNLAAATVSRANALHDEAHGAAPAESAVDPGLAAAFSRTLGDLGRPTVFVPARPKGTLLNPYFRRAGVDGMTDPYFLETLVAAELLPVERPFVLAHEWSHLAGIADEGEANFVGWLTCMRGGPADQYSAALFLYAELSAVLSPRDRAQIGGRMAEGPREDLLAIARRHANDVNPRVAAVGWRVYDRYLKANRVERGSESYADVVRLVLGVHYSPEGAPLLKSVE